MPNPMPSLTAALRAVLGAPAALVNRLAAAGSGPTVRAFDPLVFLRELASILRSNVPLHQALAFTADSFGRRARQRVDDVRRRVEAGEPLSQALAVLPERWAPASLRASVAAGERAGRLPEVLDALTDELEHLSGLDRRLRSTMVYPLAVLCFAAVVLDIAVRKVVPVLVSVYEGLGEAPVMARLVVAVWDVVGGPLLVVLPVLLVYQVVTLNRPVRFPSTANLAGAIGWRLPVVNGLRRALVEIRFARTLRLLLDAGVPLPEAVDLCEPVVADHEAGPAIVAAARRLRAGERPSEVLRGLAFLSPAYLWFLAGSESRGDFLEVTGAMAAAAEERFATKMEVVERLLEPLCTVALGLVVGVVVIALYQMVFGLVPLVGSA